MSQVTQEVEDRFQSLINTNLDRTYRVNLGLASFRNGAFLFQKPQIQDSFAQWLKEMVNSSLLANKVKWEQNDVELCTYASGDKPNTHEIQHVDLSKHSHLQQIIEKFRTLNNWDLFVKDRQFLESLRFYAIVAEKEEGDPLVFFRVSSKMYAAKSTKKYAILDDAHGLTLADPPLFLFDTMLDCVCSGSDIFVFTGRNDQFHQMFRFYEEAVKQAHKNADELGKRVPINNFDQFKKSCGSFDVANRLNAIVADGVLDGLDIESIAQFIANEDIGVKVIEINGEKKLDFEPRSKWAFINLLQDSNLESPLTKRKYLASYKRPRQSKGDTTPKPKDNLAGRVGSPSPRPRRASPASRVTNP